MSNMLMIHHAAMRGNERRNEQGMGTERDMRGDYDRRNAYEQPGMSYGGHDDQPGMRQPNQYTTRDDYGGGVESRYRGKDGRWKAGTRRSEYDGGAMDYEPEARRMGDDEDEERRKYQVEVLPSNVVRMPERMNSTDYRTSRQIGFGAMNAMGGDETKADFHSGMHAMHGYDKSGMGEGFGRAMAEQWVQNMEPEDRKQPKGGKWTPEMIRPIAQKYGIDPNSERFWEFYAVMNAIYSDTSMIAQEYGIMTPDYYAKLAKAWLEDRDAVDNKAEMYYKYIVKHE